ncbi:MAG: hypothetical protein M1819_007027 [Sarea resinae]|nr:MAG: hypothetical protein M1819_007027 [Sarea resinae]
MAPDRGASSSLAAAPTERLPLKDASHDTDNEQDIAKDANTGFIEDEEDRIRQAHRRRSQNRELLMERAEEGQNFTWRGILVGLLIGVLICFSNMYFGLQTGWVSSMAMPSALIGFAFFKTVARYIDYPFTPVENVLVQTVAGSLGTMPLGCGFVGVIPALNFLLKPEENGPLNLSMGKLMIWSIGVCFFGVVFAVPLRRQVIIREKLKFPSGTATALMIGVLHGDKEGAGVIRQDSSVEVLTADRISDRDTASSLSLGSAASQPQAPDVYPEPGEASEFGFGLDAKSDWKAKIRLLVMSFAISAVYILVTYFVPQLRRIPIFGLPLAHQWLWTLDPSPAYIGQGLIMGPATTLHMLLGAIVGWGMLSPLAKHKGWAPGPVSDWATGSKGWIVWVSLAIMLADSVISLGWLAAKPLLSYARPMLDVIRKRAPGGKFGDFLKPVQSKFGYTALRDSEPISASEADPSHTDPQSPTTMEVFQFEASADDHDAPEVDAPRQHLISNRTVGIGLIASLLVCIVAVRLTFGDLVPLYATVASLFLALLLSIMGVRALGETDLNPVSGISKLSQLFFALIIPQSNPNAVIINLVAGAISESGALQAGDLMQDLKTGHLLGAAPSAQFYGQIIGSFVGAVVSAAVYKLYVNVYHVPGGLFQVPTGYVWIFTARLVTGKGLPEMAWQWALGAGVIFAVATTARIAGRGKPWQSWIPGGIAVAVGMYNTPSFTLARTMGGLLNWYWRRHRGREETPVIVLASGLILGEGLVSIVNLGLASAGVPHL